LIESGHLFDALGLPPLSPTQDQVMVCGGPSMLADTRALLDARGFVISPNVEEPGDYVIERAFVTHSLGGANKMDARSGKL
jgi:ferredoxin--NADP+ reductase